MTEHKPTVFRFADIEVRESDFALMRAGETVGVEPTAFRVLLYLLRNPGRLVTKDEIIAAVWHDTVVSDNSLTRSVATLRRVLNDSSREPRYIATVQTLGYRFLVPVQECGNASEPESGPESESVKTVPPTHKVIGILTGGVVAISVIAGIWLAHIRRAGHLEDPSEQQITHNSNDNPITSVAVSPDGKYLAYSDLGGLHVKLIETREIHDFPQPPELGQARSRWLITWLPDSARFLAVSWGLGMVPSTYQASVVSGAMHLVEKDEVAWSVSPDGSQIAFTTEGESKMWISEIGGGKRRKIADAGPNNWFSFIEWSPDGSRLLYIKRVPGADRLQNFMEIQDTVNGGTTTLLSDESLDNLYWLHDGRILYVMRDTDPSVDSCQTWVARLDNGFQKFSTQPRPLIRGSGSCFSSISATANGKRLYVLKRNSQFGIYVADLEAGATRMSPPKHLRSTDDRAFPAAWTSDSRDVIFVSTREHRWGFYRQPPDSETATPILADVGRPTFPRVSPDGEWLIYALTPPAYEGDAPIDLFKVPINGGPPQQIMRAAVYDTPRCSRSKVTPCATAAKNKDLLTFTAFDPTQGRGRDLARFKMDEPEKFYTWDLSPDGTRIAILKRGGSEIHILDLKTLEDRKIIVKGWSGLAALDWTPDGKGLFTSSRASGSILLQSDLDGNAHLLWEPGGMRWFGRFHPRMVNM